jgi:hypothetical protein
VLKANSAQTFAQSEQPSEHYPQRVMSFTNRHAAGRSRVALHHAARRSL